MTLLHNHIFLLIAVTLIGTGLGKIRLGSFSLGSSGIIFIALIFGHFGFILPDDFQTLGLVFFIYAIGLQAGPGFFRSFGSGGIKLTLGALATLLSGFLTALLISIFYGFSAETAAGLFSGALTSTPGLAVAVEMAGETIAPAAYGLTYFFGVTGVIVFIQLLPKIMSISIPKEEQKLQQEVIDANQPITIQHIELTNPNIFDRKVGELGLSSIATVVITRLLREGAKEPMLVGKDTVLKKGDHLRLAGRKEDLQKMQLFLGQPIEQEIEFERALEKKTILVSKKNMAAISISQLNCYEVFNVRLTRVTRNGIELPATPSMRLHIGDIVHAIGDSKALENLTKIFGNDVADVFSINLMPIFVGIFFGFLIGKIPLYIPFGGTFFLGTTGGVLAAGIILSNLYRTGPFTWEIPATANKFLRDLGLILFLATVGTKTGATIVSTIRLQGLDLFIAGILVTIVPLIVSLLVCKYLLKIPFLRILGVITGAMTSTPGLAAATDLSTTHFASSAYATVYPLALISMILLTKLLILFLP